MKRRIVSIAVSLGLLVGLLSGLTVIPAQAATEGQIEQAISDGCAFLAWAQNADGSWGDADQVSRTGLAVVKLEERAFELGFESPFDEGYAYSSNVTAGLDYIFSQAGSYGPGTGICFEKGEHETYSTGIAMMTIAASKAPNKVVSVANPLVNGLTYQQVVQANVDYFAWAQFNGGWRYKYNDPWSDNSNTGYATLGLSYAKVFGCNIPGTLITNLSGWIDWVQNDPGTADDDLEIDPDGGSGYATPDYAVNMLKTGNLLVEMALVGDPLNADRVQQAINYIERHWDDVGIGPSWDSEPGWRGDRWYDDDGDGLIDEDRPEWPVQIDNDSDGQFSEDMGLPHYQAMYCLMKGLEAYGIETLTVIRDDVSVEVDWFDEMADAIVATQMPTGWWWMDWFFGDHLLATPFALLTLEIVIPDVTPPVVWIVEGVNPSGKKVPPAGSSTLPGPKGGINDDGFYTLFAEDTHDPFPYMIICYWDPEAIPPPGEVPADGTPGWWVAVTDKAGDVFFCFSGTVIKLTQAPGAPPSVKKMGSSKGKAGAVDYHITVPGHRANLPAGYPETIVVAYDASGNSSWTVGEVPPPPK